jgi:hypothetical protein
MKRVPGGRWTRSVAVAVVCVGGAVIVAFAVTHAKRRGAGLRRAGPPDSVAPRGCSATFASASAVEAAVRTATARAVLCLSTGVYPGLVLRREASSDVTVEAVPGERVTISAGAIDSHRQVVAVVFEPGTGHIVLQGLYITNEVELEPGDVSIRIDHNDISGGAYGIRLDSENCLAPNAPTWEGCRPLAKINDTTISGNRIHDIVAKADALNVNNYATLRITHNDIYNIIEGGHHSDCLQSTFGGTNLVFDRNYEHDNECQGFFLKDGDVSGATLDDNLFVSDDRPALNGVSSASSSQVWNTEGFVAEHNSVWDGKGLTLRCVTSRVPCTATVRDNILASLTNGSGSSETFALTESDNGFGRPPWSFRQSASDQIVTAGMALAAANSRHGMGVDWTPADQQYGP